MSTISASTTSTTAFKITTDTTGALVFQTGASPTTAMTLGSDQSVTFAGTPTYSGGTANGVAYLNGSKVFTTGTSLAFSIPTTNQATLTVGNGSGTAAGRNTLYMAPGGYNDQPGNQSTASNGDKVVLYDGANRSAMGIGSDYNWWSQSKTFEWWLSPTNLSTTVTKQLVLSNNALDFGVSVDNVPRRISVSYSTVPLYISNSYDGTSGISTISNNIWNTSNGSYSWSSFNNTGYAAAALQLWTTSTGSYITWGAATAANTSPTGGGKLDKYGIISGNSAFNRTAADTTVFPNWISGANLNAATGSNRVLFFEGNSSSGGSNWFGLGTTQAYAQDWDTTSQTRWANVSSAWYKTHELVRNTGMESQYYNPAFLYEVTTGTTYTSGWNKITYSVTGGQRRLSRNSVGYDASSRFTAPQAGWYFFSAQISFSASNDTDGTIKLLINGDTSSYSPSCSALGGSTYPGSRQVSGLVYLSAGDYVETYCYFSGNTNTVRGSQPYAGSFSGFFVG